MSNAQAEQERVISNWAARAPAWLKVEHNGKPVVVDATARLKAQEASEPVGDGFEPIITIAPTHSAHAIIVSDRYGHKYDLDLVLTWGALDDVEWYKHQINRLELQMLETEDRTQAQDIGIRLRNLRREYLKLYAPKLADTMLEQIDPAQHDIIWVAIERLQADAQDAIKAAKKKWWDPVRARRGE